MPMSGFDIAADIWMSPTNLITQNRVDVRFSALRRYQAGSKAALPILTLGRSFARHISHSGPNK
jgi:hypothetical protein